MATKIMLDAGHGGYDNGASYNGRNEKDDNLKLTLAVGDYLKKLGYDVLYTRQSDVYDSPVQKARIGNEAQADYFVSIHRNSSPTPNQHNGVQTLIYNDAGIKKDMALAINSNLEKLGFRNINVDIRPNLSVLRRTKMPALLVEAGFINNDADNKLFDAKFNEIAKGIADGIDTTLKQKQTKQVINEEKELTSVFYKLDDNFEEPNKKCLCLLAGVYKNDESAQKRRKQLYDDGFISEVVELDGLYQLRVGCFETINEVKAARAELLEHGVETIIIREM